jgi:hypothetical protein
MSQSIVRQLVMKDLLIMRTYVLLYWIGGFFSIAFVVFISSEIAAVVGFILFVAAMAGAGIHAMFQTVVEERIRLNLPFVMSLPVTVKEYTVAKLIANLLIFVSVWITLSAASFAVFIGDDGMPDGTMPFMSIILVAILMAYTLMLSTAIISASQGYTIVATVVGNIGLQAYLWLVADLYPIRSFIGGTTAVWNTTVVTILFAQLFAVVALLVLTVLVQFRKKDFI